MSVSKNMESLIDVERYPLRALASPEGLAFVQECRQKFNADGLCELPGFVHQRGLGELAEEATAVSDLAWRCSSTHNAWLDDPHLAPAGTVQARPETTRVGSVAFDHIGPRLRSVYEWDPLKDFLAGVLGKPQLYRLADPLGACSINVFDDSGVHGWHFDEAEFTITLMLQAPVEGGAFEYVPRIRGTEDEHSQVSDILDGKRDNVRELPFTPGTLLIFAGRETIHRVTDVSGDVSRFVAVLCYADAPDVRNSANVQRLFWGRTA